MPRLLAFLLGLAFRSIQSALMSIAALHTSLSSPTFAMDFSIIVTAAPSLAIFISARATTAYHTRKSSSSTTIAVTTIVASAKGIGNASCQSSQIGNGAQVALLFAHHAATGLLLLATLRQTDHHLLLEFGLLGLPLGHTPGGLLLLAEGGTTVQILLLGTVRAVGSTESLQQLGLAHATTLPSQSSLGLFFRLFSLGERHGRKTRWLVDGILLTSTIVVIRIITTLVSFRRLGGSGTCHGLGSA